MVRVPGWVEHVIWWQVYPLGFVGAEKSSSAASGVQHRLPGAEWLDYLVSLGANGLALGPIFASQTHGYDTTDYLRIDPRLGDDADFDRLVDACRQRGIRILLDGVFNHVGRAHPRFAAAVTEGPDSDAGQWFRFDGDQPQVFEGHEQLVALNHDHPAVEDLVVEVMCHWLERAVDGWRLDAAYAVPAAFWAKVLPRVRKRFGDAWFVGEMIHGDYAGYVAESGLDSVTEYELWKATWSSIAERNFFELDWTLRRHNELLAQFLPLTFVGNHDVTRLASIIADPRHVPHAVALLMFLGGVPSIYYGDEQGFLGIKEERFGGDDAIRPAFPHSPDELTGWDHFALHQQWIGLRRRHPWLTHATSEAVQVSNTALAVSARAPGNAEVLTLLLNLDDQETTFEADLGTVSVLEQSPGSRGDAQVVAPHGWAVVARVD